MRIIGVDEVGRGPLAGPVVAAATVFEENTCPEEFTDSKKLSAKKRESLFAAIQETALDWCIVAIGPETIDAINIREASKLAMSIAVGQLAGEKVLVDGNMRIATERDQETIVKGDLLHREIGAASILAKVWRDLHMQELDTIMPGYGLGSHAGYPTKTHKEAIANLGPSPYHRGSFRGVKEHLAKMRSGDKDHELRIITQGGEDRLQTFNPKDWFMGRKQSSELPQAAGI